MKAKIKNALETKYKNLGFGDKAFEGVADYLANSVTEEAGIDTAIAGVEQLLKAFQSDTDRTRTAKAEAERKLKDLEQRLKSLGGEPEKHAEPEKTKLPDDAPAWAKSLLDSNKELTDTLARMQQEKTTLSRREQLAAITGKLPEHLRRPYNRISVEGVTDEQFASLTAEVKEEVDNLLKETSAQGAVFGRPKAKGVDTSGKTEPASEAEVEALIKGLRV
jgi:phage shock protein A